MTEEELKAIAAQLGKPHGEDGIKVGQMMNESNIRMIQHAVDRLNLSEGNRILEIGHGNGAHLSYIFDQKPGLSYVGLEISELMHEEALNINKPFGDSGQATFLQYIGDTVPFAHNSFDRIFTVNTIYFWSEPVAFLLELYRVLKPNGICNITFAQKSFMEHLPFTRFGFELYDNEKIAKMIGATAFKIIGSETQTETIKGKEGKMVQRDFTTVSLEK